MGPFERMLFSAISAGNTHLATLCCDAGADLEAINSAALTPLASSVLSGQHDIAKILLERGADPRVVTRDGIAPFGLAAAANDVRALRELASFCAGFEATVTAGKGCLQVAIESGSLDAIEYLLAHGADPGATDSDGNSLLQQACSLALPAIVQNLLEHGADPGHRNHIGRSVLEDALHSGVYQVARDVAMRLSTKAVQDTLRERSGGDTNENEMLQAPLPLYPRIVTEVLRWRLLCHLWIRQAKEMITSIAAKRNGAAVPPPTARMMKAIDSNDFSGALAALWAGADSNACTENGCPAIVAAANAASDAVDHSNDFVLALLACGASTSSRDPVSGETILHVACRTNQTSTVKSILETRAGRQSLNASDNLLNRPLHLATIARHHEAITALYRAGADMNPVNRDGLAPIHLAAMANDVKTAQALLKHDANMRLRTSIGQTIKQVIADDVNPDAFLTLLKEEETRRKRPSIFSSNHPLASLADASGVNLSFLRRR